MATGAATLGAFLVGAVFIPYVNFIVVSAYTFPLLVLSDFLGRPDLIDRTYATILPHGQGWFLAIAFWTLIGLATGLALYVIRYFIYKNKGFPVPPLGLNGFVTIVAFDMLVCLVSFAQFVSY